MKIRWYCLFRLPNYLIYSKEFIVQMKTISGKNILKQLAYPKVMSGLLKYLFAIPVNISNEYKIHKTIYIVKTWLLAQFYSVQFSDDTYSKSICIKLFFFFAFLYFLWQPHSHFISIHFIISILCLTVAWMFFL